MESVLIFIGLLILLDVAAWFWGVDSRGLGTDDRRPWI
jgi:hypothetical protein